MSLMVVALTAVQTFNFASVIRQIQPKQIDKLKRISTIYLIFSVYIFHTFNHLKLQKNLNKI